MKNYKEYTIEELLADESPIEHTQLDLNLIRTNLPTYTNERLCEMVVCDRYFNFNRTLAVMAMEELSKRRQNGDTFDFEKYIDDAFNSLPKLDFGMPDLRSVLQQAIGKKGSK